MAISNWDKQTKYALVISTNQYAGVFDRAMCSFLTGYDSMNYPGGDEYLGKDARDAYMKLAIEEGEENVGDEDEPETHYFITEYLQHLDGEHGRQVVTTAKNANRLHNDVVIFFEEMPPLEYFDLMISRIKDFPAAYASKGFRNNSQLQILGAEWRGYEVIVKTVVRTLHM